MEKLETIHDYLRLCGRQHKRRYVAISVMLSCSIFVLGSADFVGNSHGFVAT